MSPSQPPEAVPSASEPEAEPPSPEAAPSRAPVGARPSLPRAPTRRFSAKDWAGGFLDTQWQCTTFGGTHLTHVFYRRKDGAAMVVVTKFWIAHSVKPPQEHYEYYEYSSRTHLWIARLTGGKIIVSAPAWNGGPIWTFTGSATEAERWVPTQMRFTALPDGSFRREFREERAGVWVPYAGETCSAPKRR
jgi:hypothetical protein